MVIIKLSGYIVRYISEKLLLRRSIIVWDNYDNVVYHIIQVTVLEVPTTTITSPSVPTTTPIDPTPLVIGIIAGGGAILVIIVILVAKKKK